MEGPLRHARRVACIAAALLSIASCAPTVPKPGTGTSKATKPRPKAGYESRVDELAKADASGLAGRRIALDPGHGGWFRGALGVNGLTEAEVNLGVALHLRGLLEAKGAQVFLTRSDDRDFLTPSDSSLRGDLSERIRLANAFEPDLFVSIHHNADAGGAHDVNEIQTYYTLGDEGPSLDAAQSVHRFLVRNLGIDKHRVVPGNYHVLRNSVAPGLLTESSYITNPDVEAKLALASKQRLEAEALYLGIAHYFGRRGPQVLAFEAVGAGGRADTVFAGLAAPLLRARIEGEFDSWSLALDGVPLDGTRRGDALEWRPGPLAGGAHEARLAVRLAGRGAAREQRLRFRMERRPSDLVLETVPAPLGLDAGIVAIRAEVRDDFGLLWNDSAQVRIAAVDARMVAPAETVVVARDGVAWAYARVPRRGMEKPVQVRASLVGSKAEPVAHTIASGARARDTRVWLGFAQRMPEGRPLAAAPGTREPEPTVSWINRDGFGAVTRERDADLVLPAVRGYRLWDEPALPPRFVAIAGGALHGRRIVIDPDGGGENAAGTGRDGTRAANLNLEVARALAGFLTAAGADVSITRAGDFALSEVERVEKSEDFGADRFLRIGHRAEPPRLGHYYSSAAGKRWAERLARDLRRLGHAAPAIAEDAQYPLQQTSCPALYVSAARVDDAAAESRLLSPGGIRAEAYALFLALAGEWAGDAEWPIDSVAVRDLEGRPVAGAAVTLGGAIVLETGASGVIRFARTEPGPMLVEVQHPRVRSRKVVLESERGSVVTGTGGP